MLWQRINAWYTKIPYALKTAVLIALVVKLAVFTVGFVSASAVSGVGANTFGILMNMFAKWDTNNYTSIAQHGYVNHGDMANYIVFFPLYPLLIRLITFNFSYANLSGLIISNVASIVAVVYLFKLARLDYSDSVAKKAVLFLCVFPTAYFLSAVYTEGLFLALIIASFYYARKANWPLAAALGFFAALTRIGGLIILPALVIEYFHQKHWQLKAAGWKWLWLVLPVLGFLVYLGINYQVTGNFLTFLTVERVHWYQSINPLQGFNRALSWPNGHTFPDNLTIGYAEIIFAVFGYIMIGLAYLYKLRPSYQVYMFLTWTLAVSTGFWISIPRYVLTMFPMFLALGLLSTKKSVNIAIVIVSCIGLAVFTWIFASGVWAF